MNNSKKDQLKEKLLEETRELTFLFVYLFLFLNALTIFHSLVLGQNILSFVHLGYNLFEALVLAKIILLGQMFHLGERYADKSLIIPAMYKAIVFTFFVLVFSIGEHFLLGTLEGRTWSFLWEEFTSKGINVITGKLIIAFLFFILLFSFLEVGRVMGVDKLFDLFFRRNSK